MKKIKQSLTYLVGPFLIIAIISMSIVFYMALPNGSLHLSTSERIKLGIAIITCITASLYLSNQKNENKVVTVLCFLLFWISAASAVWIFGILIWAHSWLARNETIVHILLKYSLPILISVSAIGTGIWRFRKSSLIKFRSGFSASAAIVLLGMFFVDIGWLKYRSLPRPEFELNQAAPEFSAPLRSGQTVSLKDLRGKVVVLDFWASWCGPCISALPDVQKVYEKYRNTQDVAIFATNVWEHSPEQKRILLIDSVTAMLNLTVPVLMVDDVIGTRYRVHSIPMQFYIDKTGIVRHIIRGYSGSDITDEMSAVIEKLR